ncbi:MazG nucleotide pyrophosphohydrolase domain-containing protein [Virgibacillus sp. Bac330]|uniref:MazG nucleotide pyrophosphohydrolase domain-containing protein n=1 Tax=Virgibacillus sp. Bac330 TaxID=2419841 RepID=UPI000EF4D9B8|nr:MazG-like family protein [Virgibacillus sp. Bac330]
MNVIEFQQWVKEYYESRGWSELDIFIRIGFLAEETGEVARAIRALEIGRDRPDEMKETYEKNKQALTEELGDVLGNLIVIANKYNIPLEDVFQSHKKKLSDRYFNDEANKSFNNQWDEKTSH